MATKMLTDAQIRAEIKTVVAETVLNYGGDYMPMMRGAVQKYGDWLLTVINRK